MKTHRDITYLIALLFVFLLPFENVVLVPLVGTLESLVGLILAGSASLTILSKGRFRRLRRVHYFLYAFILWNVASLLWTESFFHSSTLLVTLVQTFALVMIMWNVLNNRERLLEALQVLVIGAYVPCAILTFNYLTGALSEYDLRATIPNTNENDIALTLAIIMPIAWFMFRYTETGRVIRWMNLLYPVFALVGIIFTVSRGGLISTLPFFVYAALSLRDLKGISRTVAFVSVGLGSIIALALTPTSNWARLISIQESLETRDVGQRYGVWVEGLSHWASSGFTQLFGVGSGAFEAVIGHVAHNIYVSVLVEQGLVGLLLFGLVVITVAVGLRRSTDALRAPLTVSMITWALGVVALSWQFHKVTWTLFALAISVGGLPQRQRSSSANKEIEPRNPLFDASNGSAGRRDARETVLNS